ncbi:MAG: methyltransferase domain-containing protein [Pseudomonadales bacterium]|nr:methyltransferase domain-containing protein [Pseudomonadales bacterium]
MITGCHPPSFPLILHDELTPEAKFVLACASPNFEQVDNHLQNILAARPDIDKIIWLAHRHRMKFNVLNILTKMPVTLVPQRLRNQLNLAQRAQTLCSMKLLQTFAELQQSIGARGMILVPNITLLLGHQLYANIAAAPNRALDIFTLDEDLHSLQATVQKPGNHARLISQATAKTHGLSSPASESFRLGRLTDLLPEQYDPRDFLTPLSIAGLDLMSFNLSGFLLYLALTGTKQNWRSLNLLSYFAKLWTLLSTEEKAALEQEPLVRESLQMSQILQTEAELPGPSKHFNSQVQTFLGKSLLEVFPSTAQDEPAKKVARHVSPMPSSAPASLGEFVETEQETAKALTQFAQIKSTDVCVDLGCGNAAILIFLARTLECRCIGYEIDSALVNEARARAAKAGVSHLVDIKHSSVMDANLTEVSVVISYLRTYGNCALLPLFKKRLKPGSTIITRDFHFEQWPPLASLVVETSALSSTIFFKWVWR